MSELHCTAPADNYVAARESPAYDAPPNASKPIQALFLEILKGGQVVGRIELADKDRFLLGRADTCDIVSEHASTSRFHAMIQHCRCLHCPTHLDEPLMRTCVSKSTSTQGTHTYTHTQTQACTVDIHVAHFIT